MQSGDKLRTILSDLGKSTLRGIRKCPKCGTFNGIRGLSCKNKECNAVFKEAGDKRKQPLEVVKLDTGSSTQIFSVRVRDKGPDYRGFVQLPITQSSTDDVDNAYLPQVSALCFVDSCQRLFNTNILKCHERQAMQSITTCSHVQLAMKCSVEAQVLKIENEAIQFLNTTAEMKENIFQLANQTPGPLVQRVSKNIMAVKCKVTTKHPLGYLHVSFFTSSKFKENHFTCTCSTFKNQGKSNNGDRNCVHYYACIAAFSSNPKCSEEFSSFIVKERILEAFIEITPEDEQEKSPLLAMLDNTIKDAIEVVDKDTLLPNIAQDLERLSSVVDVTNDLEEELDHQTLESIMKPNNNYEKKTAKVDRKRKELSDNSSCITKRKALKKDFKKQIEIGEPIDESKTELSFIEWLASVTERINQAMHYQFDGKPDPLVFHAPHDFFECLLNRFMSTSVGGRRKRLPNFITTFSRKSAPPIGNFHNYTWHVTNILHAKAIFDTPLITLNVSQGFIKNIDGTYEEFNPKDLEEGLSRKEGRPPIRPIEYKTYLKIGNTSPNQEVPSVLAIDWTPDVLPLSKIGELKITFEYGHTQPPAG